jgi:hypothetical protein
MQEDVFRIESTDRWLRFEHDSTGRINGTRYRVLGEQVLYHKTRKTQ